MDLEKAIPSTILEVTGSNPDRGNFFAMLFLVEIRYAQKDENLRISNLSPFCPTDHWLQSYLRSKKCVNVVQW